ncbi:MAG: hypothetical protein GY946_10390 [bacterium]|nr:hypothetical protein [bacterium]
MKALRILLIVGVVLLVLGWLGRVWLLGAEPFPETSSYELDLAEVRRVAAELPGQKPLRVNEELVAEAPMPRAAVFAGESFDPHPMVHRAFQVVWEDRSVAIDSAMGEAMAEEMSAASGGEVTFHAEAYQRMQEGLARAEAIVFTHEHQDHIDGVAKGDVSVLASRVRFNSAQLANLEALDLVAMPEAVRTGGTPLAEGRYVPVAPGVVAIEAAGHTPGNQIIYVGLRDGRELLFVGDTAWHMRQIRELIYRPRLVTDVFLDEDRAATMAEILRLHELDADGVVKLVVSHDKDQRERLLEEGWIGPRFE